MKKAAISQSNYIPWKGFFDNINSVDEFVLYDDMQYTKRDWRNRNMIKTPNGLQWLTIPVEVKGKFFQKINETKISDPSWNKNHWLIIKQFYAKSACFDQVKVFIEELYSTATMHYLSEINFHFINAICNYLNIKTKLIFSNQYQIPEGKTERLVSICKQMETTDYYSGPAAKDYMQTDLFESQNINVHYFDYSGYPEYPQLYPPFQHGVSILDLLFNMGNESAKYMKSFNDE